MMRTEAPKERAGRGLVNLARTTPELPWFEPLLAFMSSQLVGPSIVLGVGMYREGG